MQTTSSNRKLFKRLTIRFIIAITIILFVIYGLPLVFTYFYPFIFAIAIAAMVNPLVNRINKWLSNTKIKTSTSRSIITFIFTIFILLSLILFSYLIVSTLLKEIFGLATSIQENWPAIVRMFENTENWLMLQMNLLPPEAIEIIEGVIENLLLFLRTFSGNLLNYTVTFSGLFISSAGALTLNLITFFLSLYFIMTDFDLIVTRFKEKTNDGILNTLSLLKDTTIVGVGGYLKTQLLLALLAFIVMFISFTLYGQEYALTIAIILAIIDVIPLIGTIAILLPWGIFEFILSDPNFGIFLIILGVCYFILRRMLEPKIMGSQTGLHPIFALIGIYVGIQFSGLWGALLGPLVMVVLIGIIKSGILDNTFADISELYHKISFALSKNGQ